MDMNSAIFHNLQQYNQSSKDSSQSIIPDEVDHEPKNVEYSPNIIEGRRNQNQNRRNSNNY